MFSSHGGFLRLIVCNALPRLMFSSIVGSIVAGALFIFATSVLFESGGPSLFCNAVLSVISNFAIISLRKRELVAL